MKFRKKLLLLPPVLLVAIIILGILIYTYIGKPFQISGRSMEPALPNGTYYLTFRYYPTLYTLKRGDIVTFRRPDNSEVDYVARVIGLPGDGIYVENGNVYVNDALLEEPYVSGPTKPGPYYLDGVPRRIPEGHVFILGDNRQFSSDSREYGFVPLENIRCIYLTKL